jgi:hypothetical protein
MINKTNKTNRTEAPKSLIYNAFSCPVYLKTIKINGIMIFWRAPKTKSGKSEITIIDK